MTARSSAHPYIPNSDPAIKRSMLYFVGVGSIDDLYSAIPSKLRVNGLLNLPAPLNNEQDLAKHVTSILKKNSPQSARISFLGAGTYNHYVPAVVDEVINRSEFLTAYAGDPYEDHGRFQALFEYESLMAELVNMDVVNVPTYDGLQAAATSLAMAYRITGRKKILVVTEVNPDKYSKVRNYNQSRLEFIDIPTNNLQPDLDAIKAALNGDVAAIWLDTPNYLGTICSSVKELADLAHANGSLLVVGVDPISLGVLQSPADQGADIINGDIQSLGVHCWFGGGHGGFIAVHDDPKFVMELPSRLFGMESTTVPGEYGFGDVAYERTSFALREEGKEWVGTAAALWGIASAVYLSLMGPRGMVEVGETIIARTRYAMHKLGGIAGVKVSGSDLQFREFVLDLSQSGMSAKELIDKCRERNIEPGVQISDSQILVCVTEMNSEADINALHDAIVAVLGGAK
jgi:glycine dehydrogenase subunit 1